MLKVKRGWRPLGLVLAVLCLAASAQAQPEDADRFEKLNRKTQAFNDFMDSKLVRPIAKGYAKVMPKFLQARVRAFFRNLGELDVLVNDALQGKAEATLTDGARLLLNSTIGIGGLFDPAAKIGLRANDEDFGQTVAVWGAPQGPYLVVPLMGPSTVRDALTLAVDSTLNPLYLVEHIRTRNSLIALKLVQKRTDLLPLESFVVGDKYDFYRDAYLQHRDFEIHDGEVEDTFDDDF